LRPLFKRLLKMRRLKKLRTMSKRDQEEITTAADVVVMVVVVAVTTVEIVVDMVHLALSELKNKSSKLAMMRKKERISALNLSSVTKTRNSTLRMRRTSPPFDEPLLQ